MRLLLHHRHHLKSHLPSLSLVPAGDGCAPSDEHFNKELSSPGTYFRAPRENLVGEVDLEEEKAEVVLFVLLVVAEL